MADTYEELRGKALESLERGNAREAFGHFRWALEYPGRLPDEGAWPEALAVLARIVGPIAGDEFAGFVRAAADAPGDARALYDLGYQLYEQSLHGIAATVLARALPLSGGAEPVLTELVCALEGAGFNEEAVRFLREAGGAVESSFLCAYLLTYNQLMSGDLAGVRSTLPTLLRLHEGGPEDDNHRYMVAQVRAMAARADAVAGATSLDLQDLRGWHFVVTGGLLLHVSPYGFDEGMNGRYAFTQDSDERCAEGLRRARAVLAARGREPERVLLLPERNSAILGLAAARLLGVPAEPWNADARGLVVAYDLDALGGEVLGPLMEHRPGQPLFVQAACWTSEPPFVGDLTTYLYQHNEAPWGARMRIDPETRTVSRAEPSTEPAEELAGRVLAAATDPDEPDDLPALLALADAAASVRGDAAPGLLRSGGRRARQRTSSPVKSSRFL